jgi:hypothetical protein
MSHASAAAMARWAGDRLCRLTLSDAAALAKAQACGGADGRGILEIMAAEEMAKVWTVLGTNTEAAGSAYPFFAFAPASGTFRVQAVGDQTKNWAHDLDACECLSLLQHKPFGSRSFRGKVRGF